MVFYGIEVPELIIGEEIESALDEYLAKNDQDCYEILRFGIWNPAEIECDRFIFEYAAALRALKAAESGWTYVYLIYLSLLFSEFNHDDLAVGLLQNLADFLDSARAHFQEIGECPEYVQASIITDYKSRGANI